MSLIRPRKGWTGALLVGGRSRRMGCNKLMLTLPSGKRLLDLPAESLRQTCETCLAIGDSPYAPDSLPGFHLLQDALPNIGPAAALLTGLSHCSGEWLLLLAGDMPQIPAEFLAALQVAAEADPTSAFYAMSPRGIEPTLAAYPVCLLPHLKERITAGERALRKLIPPKRQRAFSLTEMQSLASSHDPLLNLNRPEDWIAFTGQTFTSDA